MCGASWSVWVRALAGNIVLCSWARHLTLTIPLSTQVYKRVPSNVMLGITLRWTSIPSMESRNTPSNTPSCFMLQKLGKTPAWSATWWECRLRFTSDCTDLFSLFQVNVKVDYIKPPSDGFPERTCATVTISGINIAEALISKGFATALRHRQDDDQRSSCYDDLLAAETRAIKNGKGLHSKKESPIHRVADLSGVSQWILELTFAFTLNKSPILCEFVCSRFLKKGLGGV